MMPAKQAPPALIDRLPSVRGTLEADAPLARFTWFKVGGPAEVLFQPADAEDLGAFLAAKPADVPVSILGTASNIIVRDGGVEGVVIRIGRGFSDIQVQGNDIIAGAGANDLNVARRALDAGLGGLEFLSGIPGAIGGALRMNAGAYGREISDVLVYAEALDGEGKTHRLEASELGFGYRRSSLPEGWIFTAACLKGVAVEKGSIRARMDEIQAERETTQPIKTPTGGSTFANPEGYRAWELIEKAGLRGLKRGGAQVSELHCNFLINTGGATAADLEGLGEEIRRRVFEDSGVELEWEIRRIGRHKEGLS